MKSKKTINPVIAGATGAAVGAGIGVATSVVLNDDVNRKKMESVARTVKKEAKKYIDRVKADGTMEKGTRLVRDTITSSPQVKKVAKTKRKSPAKKVK